MNCRVHFPVRCLPLAVVSCLCVASCGYGGEALVSGDVGPDSNQSASANGTLVQLATKYIPEKGVYYLAVREARLGREPKYLFFMELDGGELFAANVARKHPFRVQVDESRVELEYSVVSDQWNGVFRYEAKLNGLKAEVSNVDERFESLAHRDDLSKGRFFRVRLSEDRAEFEQMGLPFANTVRVEEAFRVVASAASN